MTSWTQPYANVPEDRLASIIRRVEREGGKLTLITNDSVPSRKSKALNSQSMMVKDYVSGLACGKSRMMHFGIEGWSEAERKYFAKPISDEDIRKLLKMTALRKQQAEWFFIVGSPKWSMDDVHAFADTCIVPGVASSPRIYVKVTYLDASPHTPLQNVAIDPAYCDTTEVFKVLNSRNKRIRVFPTRSAARSAWRTALRRAATKGAK